MTATAAAVAFIVFSCKDGLGEEGRRNLSETPLQTVENMFFVQTENGLLKMRVEAEVMERYENDTSSFELFPKGLAVFGYSEDGLLETTIRSDNARHVKKKRKEGELWEAFGHVRVRNVIRQETMETDTLYWDRDAKEIYTDCYVKMYSPSGQMQGYGMRSDEMARNSVILRLFDGYGVVVQDTTKVVIDTANFIGPLLKK